MPRDSRVYLEDILDAISRIRRYVGASRFEAFAADERTVDAVARNLEVIGEAVKQIPAELRDSNPDIDWKRIAGFRDVLIHGYFSIDLEIIWDVVQNKLPALDARVRQMLQQ